ncbi:type II toxin-antitoxin system VapC family toxin [Candidatus Gottesmanbacteria bacterium]|nr:type II toxin-antitoxin system VapC family toxin [Candidatus Gottesmanbacteria bacterium]
MKTKQLKVIDSSVTVKWLNRQNENYTTQADKILKEVQKGKILLLQPELAKYEIANALLHKQMSLQNTMGSLSAYYSIPVQFVSQNEKQAQETIKIAYENNMTFYDAAFVAVAKEYNAPLLTDNPKHQKKTIDGVKIIDLKDYGK